MIVSQKMMYLNKEQEQIYIVDFKMKKTIPVYIKNNQILEYIKMENIFF